MNRPASSKYVPGLPDDDDIDTQTNAPVDDSIKIYDGVAECTMNDADTLKSVKSRAKDLAIQKVHQKIADYVYGFWKDRYLTLPDDEVLSIASEICTITDVKYNFIDSDDNTLVRATVLAQVDDNDVMNYIIQFFKERNELKIQNEALRKEIEDLKYQMNKTEIEFYDAFYLCLKIDREGVINIFNKAIKLKPDCSLLYCLRGIAYNYNYDNKDEAIQDFDKAIELNPNFAEAYYNRGRVCHYGIQKDSDSQDFDKAIKLNPNSAMAYSFRGSAYLYSVHKERAIDDFTKAIELYPDYDNAYNDRAITYKALKQYEQAVQDFNKLIELKPNEAIYYNNRGNFYYDLGQYEQAIQDFNKAIQLEPIHAYLGSQSDEHEKSEQAIKYLDKYIKLNPNNYTAYFIRGSIYSDSNVKQYEKAIQDFNKAIELYPNLTYAYISRGNCYKELDQYEKAIQDYSKIIELAPDFVGAYDNRGICYQVLNQYEKAIQDYSKAIELLPNYLLYYINRGHCYQELGDEAKAQADFAKAKELGYNG